MAFWYATLLKSNSDRGFFLWDLQSFLEHLYFYGTPHPVAPSGMILKPMI